MGLDYRTSRLLARVLKEGVQFWYNDTSTVKGGGTITLLHISICSKLVRNFSNTLCFVGLCCYASLLNYDIFVQPGTPSIWSKCQMYNNNENWSYFVSDLIYLVKEMKIISLSPQNLGVIPLACHLHINEVAAICTGVWNQILTFRKLVIQNIFLQQLLASLLAASVSDTGISSVWSKMRSGPVKF
jgi:hypothetical protein